MPDSTASFSTMSSAIQHADNYTGWVVHTFAPYVSGSMLEVGTGYGNYRRLLPDLERYASADIDEGALANAREAFKDGDYYLVDIGSDDATRLIPLESFDTVMCCNVLEHIEDDAKALRNMLAVLRPGGHLLLFVPALQALYSDMDRLAGHFRRYSKRQMARRFEGLGAEILRLEYFNPLGGLGWWVNKFRTINDLDEAPVNRQIEIFDRYFVPPSRVLNALSKRFFGQSLVCVARK